MNIEELLEELSYKSTKLEQYQHMVEHTQDEVELIQARIIELSGEDMRPFIVEGLTVVGVKYRVAPDVATDWLYNIVGGATLFTFKEVVVRELSEIMVGGM